MHGGLCTHQGQRSLTRWHASFALHDIVGHGGCTTGWSWAVFTLAQPGLSCCQELETGAPLMSPVMRFAQTVSQSTLIMLVSYSTKFVISHVYVCYVTTS